MGDYVPEMKRLATWMRKVNTQNVDKNGDAWRSMSTLFDAEELSKYLGGSPTFDSETFSVRVDGKRFQIQIEGTGDVLVRYMFREELENE